MSACRQSTIVLTEEDLPNWRDYIKVKKTEKAERLDVTSPFPVIEATADHKRFDEEYDKRGWPRENGKDCEYLHKAGIKETCEALGFARFPTISPGTDKTKVNCVVHRTHRGLRVVSLGDERPGMGRNGKRQSANRLHFRCPSHYQDHDRSVPA